jgi:predicted MFS family arabinose efflux permease
MLRFVFAGMSFTAGGSLAIEQLQKFHATMMSLNTAFMNGGMLLASLASAYALDLYNYQTMALLLGTMGVAGAIIWIALVKDPYKTPKKAKN